MSNIYLYTSPYPENLAGKVAQIVTDFPLPSPLIPEYFLVQTEGMKRWLSLEIARRNNIFSNYNFLSPAELINLATSPFTPERPEESPYQQIYLPWAVQKVILEYYNASELKPVREYIKGTGSDNVDPVKLYQLSIRIADLFDQYTIYRLSMLKFWENNQLLFKGMHGESWQQFLWVKLKEIFYPQFSPRSLLMEQILNADEKILGAKLSFLPSRLFVFAISVLPPLFVMLLNKLSSIMDIHVFMQSPSRHFWEHIKTEKQINLIREMTAAGASFEDILYYETGNTLLANWGTAGKDFSAMINQLEAIEWQDEQTLPHESLLHYVQSNIYELVDIPEQGDKFTIQAEDDSLQVISCYDPRREVEVLYDQLLDQFDKNPSLKPHEIAILSPDINLYTPYIEAVFGTHEIEMKIPFSISDREIKSENSSVESFMRLLELPDSRFELSVVLSILKLPVIRGKFQLSESNVSDLETWFSGSGIRWGISGAFKSRFNLPEEEQNSWRSGLKRLILGYAMHHEQMLFNDILPANVVEGLESEIMGKAISFLEICFDFYRQSLIDRTLTEWAQYLLYLMDNLFATDDDSQKEQDYLRRQIIKLESVQEITDSGNNISFRVIREHFNHILRAQKSNRGFLQGGITFCSMVPLRSVPFKQIYILGMNEENYPRRVTAPGFDLLAAFPQKGDRNLREWDRYLFLETLFAARERLVISYCGRNNRDNSERLPSMLVLELIDYLEKSCVPGNMLNSIRDVVVVQHPLQSFSRSYFLSDEKRGKNIFSYQDENCIPPVRNKRELSAVRWFEENLPLDESSDPLLTPGLDDFISFFRNPLKYFMVKRLHAAVPLEDVQPEDRENFELTGLDRFAVKKMLLNQALEGKSITDLNRFFRAEGRLPHGNSGIRDFSFAAEEIENFAEKCRRIINLRQEEQKKIQLTSGKIVVSGVIRSIYGNEHLFFDLSKNNPANRLSLWIEHLLLNSSGEPFLSRYVTESKQIDFNPLTDATQKLTPLFDLYHEGIQKILPFFPKSSWDFNEKLLKNMDWIQAIKQVNANVFASTKSFPEKTQNPYFKYFLNDLVLPEAGELFLNDFRRITRILFGEMKMWEQEVMDV